MAKKSNKLKIIPLGGLEEIGKNLTLFEYKDDIIVLDCGVAFPDEDMLGIALVIPDMSYLVKNKARIRGMVVTHGHEDHIGGIPYLLKEINVPIYGTPLTLGILSKKLKEHGLLRSAKLMDVQPGDTIKLGEFRIEFIRVNHSLAAAVAIALPTPAGTVVHTGDFKIDSTPIDGDMIDLTRFGDLGRKGVLALLSDSTNVERGGFSMSERKVGHTFEELFRGCDKRIIVATFASNVHRVQQIINCAIDNGRKVAVSGRSMESVVSAAVELGYIKAPKGTLIEECGKMLAKGPPKKDKNGNIMKDKSGKVVHEPYVIKVLNTINFSKSLHYNPFAYIRSEKDILKLVTTIIVNTKGEGEKASEDFWVKAEKLLYTALIAFIWYEGKEEEKNLNTLLDLLNESETREEDETYQNPVDMLFEELEAKEPQHFAVRQYKKYKMAAGKTAKSILISCGARLAPFDIAELREIMSYDEMELDKIGDRKTALFLIMSDTDTTFNFVIAMLQSQLFNLLCDKADDVYGGRLPVHVRVIADEFANIGQIPQFDKLIATIRSREISASIILQSQSQLKAMYKDSADTILGNCDTTLFLGGKEKTTLKEMSELLGKETIDLYNTSETRSNQKSFGLNYQKTGKQLMTEDEIAVMDGGKCILQIRGARPFFSDKYDITKHKNYRFLADENEKNRYKVEKELNPQYTPKPEEEVEVIQVELSE